MDLSSLSLPTAAPQTAATPISAPQTAAKAWSSALTSLAAAGIALAAAYVTGSKDPSVVGAVAEAVNNLFLVAVTTGVPAVLSYYVTYLIPNKPKE